MDIAYYNQEVDKILWDLLGDESFAESDMKTIIDFVAITICQYDKTYDLSIVSLMVELCIQNKYQKYYGYNSESEYNQLSKKTKLTLQKKISINPDANNPDDLSFNFSDNDFAEGLNEDRQTNINCTEDLVNHVFDYDLETYKEKVYLERKKRVTYLKKLPKKEQKSAGWIAERNECLTATAIAIAIDEDPYKFPIELFLDKCGRGEPFIQNENTHHGIKYEQIGNMYYSFRNHICVSEYGLIRHDQYKFIGASPDGICDRIAGDKTKLSTLVGRLLEIKFPKKRKIKTTGALDGEKCPHYYFVQVQTQLFVTGLDECDFLQCECEEYDSWDEFLDDTDPKLPGLSKQTHLEKGCLIQLAPKKMVNDDPKVCLYNSKYLYPPSLHMSQDQIEKWIATETINFHGNELAREYVIDRVIYWRLANVSCSLITANPEWMESKIPHLKQFWNYILFYRKHPKQLDKLVELVKELGIENSAKLFEKIHKAYCTTHQNTQYKPLFQKETVWRKKYNIKKANYQKFLDYRKNYNMTAKK